MKYEQLKNELNILRGKTTPVLIDCIIAICFDGAAVIVNVENKYIDLFDGSDLEDNLTDINKIPKEAGIYKCQISYHSYKCNNQLDPEEWDCNVAIEGCELITHYR